MGTRLRLLLSFSTLAAIGLGDAQHPTPANAGEVESAVAGHDAVREVVEKYGEAIRARDVELFREVMPGIGAAAEKRLKDAFKGIRSQQVDITIRSVDIDGPTATVLVLREDTVDGRRMKAIRQEFHLAREDERWRIHSLTVDR